MRRSLVLATLYPIDYGAGGSYHGAFKSGAMGAGLSANTPIFELRNPSTSLFALIRKFKLSAWSTTTGFTAGLATFDLFFARSYTVDDSGGTTISLSGDQCQMRTSMGSSIILPKIGPSLVAGTRTLDTYPIESWVAAAPTGATTPFATGPQTMLNLQQGEHPVMLAQNEGIVLQATVPATGTWAFSVALEWDEVPLSQF
jgi:hypothetical protein